jgi:hypothetical protein
VDQFSEPIRLQAYELEVLALHVLAALTLSSLMALLPCLRSRLSSTWFREVQGTGCGGPAAPRP